MSDDSPVPGRIARVVADADVLAADLLVGDASREALDLVRSHSWLALVASESLLDDAEATIAALAGDDLAAEWRGKIESTVETVDHPGGDHPGLASAYRGEAGHLLTFDPDLRSPTAGVAISEHAAISVRHPEAFARTFDPDPVYEAVFGETYPGPDRDPRA